MNDIYVLGSFAARFLSQDSTSSSDETTTECACGIDSGRKPSTLLSGDSECHIDASMPLDMKTQVTIQTEYQQDHR